MTHFLTDPFAPHPVVNSRNICFGGGGGGSEFNPTSAPSVPDYSQYIKTMTETGNKLQGYGADLYKWAQEQGIKVSEVADKVGARAGEIADYGAGQYKEMMAKWKEQYEPLYDAQAAEAKRTMGDLSNYKEQEAGRYGADVGQAFDASHAAQERELRRYGLKAPGSGADRVDAMARNQRGLGQVAAMEQGRRAAEDTAWKRVGEAQQAGLAFPQIGQQGAATALSAGNQQVGAPESAISTTVGAYSPSLSAYQAAYPWMKQWGDTMATGYNQQLAGYNAENTAKSKAAEASASSGGGGVGGILGGLAGTVAGSFMGPMGSTLGGMAGKALGGMMGAAEGGAIEPDRHMGGDQMVDPSMSASQGAITDDVPARLNVGEFVFPKDVVEWRGEAWMQKEIMKARREREQNTVAEPEMGPASAIDMQAPQFDTGEPPL